MPFEGEKKVPAAFLLLSPSKYRFVSLTDVFNDILYPARQFVITSISSELTVAVTLSPVSISMLCAPLVVIDRS